jgi:hypothetical protein
MTDSCRPFDRLHELISRQADGRISPEEHHELTAALEADLGARKQWFLRNDIDVAVSAWSAGGHEGVLVPDSAAATDAGLPRRFRAAALAGPLLTALAVATGVFGASAVWAFALPRSAFTETAIRVFTEGFDDGVAATVPGLPGGPGDPAVDVWRGDEACVVTSRQGVTPASGARMLAFERSTHAGEDPTASAWSDVYRFVDARSFLALAAGQPVTARLGASFTTSSDACAAGEAYSACVHIYALDRDLSSAPHPMPLSWVRDNCVASGMKRMPLACDRSGWQRVTVDASLPPEAKFVLLHIAAVRDRPAPTSEPAVFRGHFVDDVMLELQVRRTAR